MTLDIALILAILAVSLVLFITERLRMDVVALLALAAVALTGLVTTQQALAGFSNPAVVTVWAMFMLSAGLTKTGVADIIGRQLLRLVGEGEIRIVATIMLAAAFLSAFMNNIGVAALLLPVVMDIARRTERSPSRLLMPLAFGCLLGGLTTLIGTPPNLLIAEGLHENSLEPFALFDYSPVGVAVALVGIAFVALAGRRLLPVRDRSGDAMSPEPVNLRKHYSLHEYTVVMRVGAGSPLAGRTLRRSRLGSAAGLNVLAVVRDGRTVAAPQSDMTLRAGDRLLVGGQLDRFTELQGWRDLVIEGRDLGIEQLISDEIGLAELRLPRDSALANRTLQELDFRRRFGVIVLAIQRESGVSYSGLAGAPLEPGDRLLVQGKRMQLETLAGAPEFDSMMPITAADFTAAHRLKGRIFSVRVPQGSVLVGKSLVESRLGDAFRLGVLGILRGERTMLMPSPGETIESGDRLLVRGETEDLAILRGLQRLEIVTEAPHELERLESEQIGMIEVVLSPHTTLAGKTPRELHFREKYGLQVLAVLRAGEVHRATVRDMPLQFGDALLLFGERSRFMVLAREPDFIVLTQAAQEVRRTGRAPLAVLIMAGVLVPVVIGVLPIALSAVIGATLMVVLGCMTMEEAYRAIEWPAIFLIACMLPMGTAMQQTGAAAFLADSVLVGAGPLGPWGVIVGLYLITAAATMIIPTAALVVLMTPIAIKAATTLGISPHAVMMAVAMAASASFTSPISHPANLLVMGPGGYRFNDYVKLGVPLTLVVFLVVMLTLPVFWPLHP